MAYAVVPPARMPCRQSDRQPCRRTGQMRPRGMGGPGCTACGRSGGCMRLMDGPCGRDGALGTRATPTWKVAGRRGWPALRRPWGTGGAAGAPDPPRAPEGAKPARHRSDCNPTADISDTLAGPAVLSAGLKHAAGEEADGIARCAGDAARAIAMSAGGGRTERDAASEAARAAACAAGIVAEIAYKSARKAEMHRIDRGDAGGGEKYMLARAATDAAAAALVTRRIFDAARRTVADIESSGVQGSEAAAPRPPDGAENAAARVASAVTDASVRAVDEMPWGGMLVAAAACAADAAAGAVAQAAAAAAAGVAAARQDGGARCRPAGGHAADAEAASARMKVDEAVSAARAVAARADADLAAAGRLWNPPAR